MTDGTPAASADSEKYVFIPFINGIKYNININEGCKITGIKIDNGSGSLEITGTLSTISCNKGVKKINNVFVLFGVAAKVENNNNKISLKATLDPCDYVRGIIVKETNNLEELFCTDGNHRLTVEMPASTFAILNKDQINENPKTIITYLCLDEQDGKYKISVIEKDKKGIVRLNKDNITITINGSGQKPNDDVINIFRYTTYPIPDNAST